RREEGVAFDRRRPPGGATHAARPAALTALSAPAPRARNAFSAGSPRIASAAEAACPEAADTDASSHVATRRRDGAAHAKPPGVATADAGEAGTSSGARATIAFDLPAVGRAGSRVLHRRKAGGSRRTGRARIQRAGSSGPDRDRRRTAQSHHCGQSRLDEYADIRHGAEK